MNAEKGNDYTTDEMMITLMARQIRDEESVFFGFASPMPMRAAFLARELHAPNITILSGVGVIDPAGPRKIKLPDSSADPSLMYGSRAVHTLNQLMVFNRGNVIAFLSGVSIDKYGNLNLSVIGDPKKPKIRFPGPAATGHIMALAKRVILFRHPHDTRSFVEKVPYITAPGWLTGPGSREEAGLTEAPGPERVITPLAVMGFDDETKIMKLESLHPGVALEEVKQNTGFELIIPPEIPQTKPPTARELDILRKMG